MNDKLIMLDIDRDIELLRKYHVARDIDDDDYERINALCEVGLMKKSMSFRRMKIVAKTTKLGNGLIK